MRRRHRKGFTLIELLVVVAIIGVLAAIAIVNYLNALNRARQKRTMSDIRTIASAWEARAAEAQSYSAAGFSYPTAVIPYPRLQLTLTPGFIKSLPQVDGWGYPLEFAAEGKMYAIRSPGRDGLFEGTSYTTDDTLSPDCDIVFSNGTFVRFPNSIQTQ
ncbi:MAG: prepilin-type N-terminal cleavage/methylation domain-containing protein [Acidobacteriota bacterium]